jgi:hypothetical protein
MRERDELEIRRFNAVYNRAIDAGDAQTWADTFLDAGVFIYTVRSWSGKVELRKFVEERTVRNADDPPASPLLGSPQDGLLHGRR